MEIVKKISWRETLKRMPVGETLLLKSKQMKPINARVLISRLRGEGYEFEATDAGLVDCIKITKLKNRD